MPGDETQRGFAESEEELLEEARRKTGLADFGGGPWREGLRVLLRAYDDEARFKPQARGRVRADIVSVLAARLGVEEGWHRDPACLEARVEAPVFVLGLPRTGTTAFHFLLAQDPSHQVLEYWLAARPRRRPPRETWANERDYLRAVEGLQQMYAQDPDLKAIHLLEADGPEECRHLLMQSFLDDTFDSNATIPSYTRWFREQDLKPSFERHRDILKLVGSATPERRWVLKYPAYMRSLDSLLSVYPDARFVWTHRDPARVLPSLCSLVFGYRSLYEHDVDAAAIGAWQLDMWSALVSAGVDQRRAADPSRFFDIQFPDLVRDPISQARAAYEHFGIRLSKEAESRMRTWQGQNPQGKHGGHRYSAEQFGLSEAVIRERFADYCAEFGVERG